MAPSARPFASFACLVVADEVAQLFARMHAEFGVDGADVGAHGVDRQRLVLGDLLGGPAAGEREEHLIFARRKSRSVRHGLASLHVAARLARVGVRLTRSQRKLLVCRKSVVYRWEKPIKPGTDLAMMLGWMHYIIENGLYEKVPGYEDFCEQ